MHGGDLGSNLRTRIQPEILVRHPDILGESPAYDASNQRLVWADMFGNLVHELIWTGGSTWQPGRTWNVGRPAAAVLPRAIGGLLVVSRTDVVALADNGETKVFASLSNEPRNGIRFNEAKCDHQGRLVAGWMAEDLSHSGAVVRVDLDGSVETILTDVGLANGFDWSPDGTTFYFIDSMSLGVDAFDYSATGTLGNRRTLVTIERGIGAPNGMTVDRKGGLWVVITYGGQMRHYTARGELVEIIELPTPVPTSCAFGGPDGDQLFITSKASKTLASSLRERLSITEDRIEAAERDEVGGALFVCRPGVSGPAATSFAG